jgi:hypothetical protein
VKLARQIIRTDLVFCSGIRVRGDDAMFVSLGTTFDRLLDGLHSASLSAAAPVGAIGR